MVQKEQFRNCGIEITLKSSCDLASHTLTETSHIVLNKILKQLGIVGISSRGTQKPAGKMKFTILFIGVMLLKGIELHRHRNRHGHNGQMTDPQRETNELNEIDKAVDKQQTVDVTEVQKDIRSNPGNMQLKMYLKQMVQIWHKINCEMVK